MTLHVGLAANTVSADAPDVRLALAGLVVRDGNGLARSGFFPNRSVTATVTGRTDMAVNIGYFNAAIALTTASGPLFFGNDGTVTSPTLAAAPASNSRYDLLYVQHTVSSTPVFGVVTGTASATPVVPTLPANSIGIATILIPSTATTTSSSGVVINEVFPYTGTTGSPIWMRTQAERDAAGLSFGQQVRRLDLDNWVEENMQSRASSGSADPGRASGWYPVSGRTPSFEVGATSSQAIATGTTTTVFGYASGDRSLWGGTGYAGSGVFNLGVAGRWLVSAMVQYPIGTSGRRELSLVDGSGNGICRQSVTDGASGTVSVAGEFISTTSSTVALNFYQVSGSNMTVSVQQFKGVYLGPN
jgi:hypothetical protein